MSDINKQQDRIVFLDGLRGVAILLVILFHAYVRWPSVVPYGNRFATFPVFKSGNLGVELFFLISGFVILMSLEKSISFTSFIYKRWLRLFPAMFIATMLVFATAYLLPERPLGKPTFFSIVPGLLFIEPSWIRTITGIQFNPLEGSFWSLFVEVKFYFIFGLSYFFLNRNQAILLLVLLFLFAVLMKYYPVKYAREFSIALSLQYFGWFASGCLAYVFFAARQLKYLLFAILVAFVGIATHEGDADTVIFSMFIFLLFILPVYFKNIRPLLANRFLLFAGFISYPLYLIHENSMIAMIVKLGAKTSIIPDLMLPLIPVALLFFVAYIISAWLEPQCRKWITAIAGTKKN